MKPQHNELNVCSNSCSCEASVSEAIRANMSVSEEVTFWCALLFPRQHGLDLPQACLTVVLNEQFVLELS